MTGITNDGASFSPGLDGVGNALSETRVGSSITFGGVAFPIGPAGVNDVVAATGQTITLTSGSFATLNFLATATNGNQSNQAFIVKYTDGTSTTFYEGISDWFAPQGYPGESIALSTPYRNTSHGGRDNRTFDVYGYFAAVEHQQDGRERHAPDQHARQNPVDGAGDASRRADRSDGHRRFGHRSRSLVDRPSGTTVTGYNVFRGTTSGGESLTPLNSDATGGHRHELPRHDRLRRQHVLLRGPGDQRTGHEPPPRTRLRSLRRPSPPTPPRPQST